MSDQPYLTAEGAARLRSELARLKSSDREAMSKRLRIAIQQGDLSENADYHKAKEDQAFLEGRILDLEYLLRNAIIVEESQQPREVVEVGAKVTVQEEGYPPETFYIVGAKEADPREGKISNESPYGRALLGGKAGDEVLAETPGGQVKLKIIQVE